MKLSYSKHNIMCKAFCFNAQMRKFRYQKLKSGVKIEEIVEGEGPETHEGDVVEINYVCRRSNGYFVHSTQNQLSGESKPVIISLDGKEVIQGLKDVLVGMKVGDKEYMLFSRRLIYIDRSLNWGIVCREFFGFIILFICYLNFLFLNEGEIGNRGVFSKRGEA
ncbi:Peptidyl-prolyl cis-trans isomerase FKBP16-1, chloroplastic [Dendrobium catenatum]|uniref:peptidylprolyl isomerase n=1 Tax=Dendrobium catenatum TaxID=906689 RepID=A0A2I0WBL8_9ASPA|nr:Peptidyl-prolyl cis-trans isomerase FKBP16-1, chloroplastic [Dendrobium catenatum]